MDLFVASLHRRFTARTQLNSGYDGTFNRGRQATVIQGPIAPGPHLFDFGVEGWSEASRSVVLMILYVFFDGDAKATIDSIESGAGIPLPREILTARRREVACAT